MDLERKLDIWNFKVVAHDGGLAIRRNKFEQFFSLETQLTVQSTSVETIIFELLWDVQEHLELRVITEQTICVELSRDLCSAKVHVSKIGKFLIFEIDEFTCHRCSQYIL